MSSQDNLNNANELGRTIAALVAQSDSQITGNNTKVIEKLIAALADKAHQLLNPVKEASVVDVVVGAGDTAHIHGDGNVELVRSGTITYIGDTGCNISDCASNNKGVPELLGECTHGTTKAYPSLQRYLAADVDRGVIDHVIRSTGRTDGTVEFYIRPMNTDGETVQFLSVGNSLYPFV